MKFIILSLILSSFCISAHAQVTETEFEFAVDRVRATYTPIVAAEGASLKIFSDWSLDEMNAYAQRPYSTFDVVVHGGIGRVPGMTPDGLSLIVCHEIGHHLGGFPKVKDWNKRWSSMEGQADYFAASKCLRRVFASENNLAAIQIQNIPLIVKEKCEAAWQTVNDRALCERVILAGRSAALSISFLGNEKDPNFETPDLREVLETFPRRTGAQCALDTFVAGALCTVSAEINFSDTVEQTGACERPHCWFAGSTSNP